MTSCFCYSKIVFLFTAVKAPKVVKPLENTTAPEQGSVKLTCKITGYPKPEVTW